MGCCNQQPITRMTVCEVCRRLDGDRSLKMCRFCNPCRAWICNQDWNNLARRAAAVLAGGS